MGIYYSANAEARWWSEKRAEAEREFRHKHGETMDQEFHESWGAK